MAHNPFNDLYVDSLEDVTRDARKSWEIAAAICNRDVRQYQSKVNQSISKGPTKKQHSKPHGLSAFSYDSDYDGSVLS